MNKVIFILPPGGFDDEEYFLLKSFFQFQGVEQTVVGRKKGLILGREGQEALVTNNFKETAVKDGDIIIMISGQKVHKLKSKSLFSFLQAASTKEVLITAFGNTPILVAAAGIAAKKKITIWKKILQKSFVREIKESEAQYIDKDFIKDDNLITIKNKNSLPWFKKQIISFLDKKQKKTYTNK